MFYLRCALLMLTALALTHPAFAETASPPAGRYQIIVVPGHPGSPFLLDSSTGCTWHLVQDEKTKRSSFIEVDVENLHWSWGSGAQSLLAARIDASNLTAEQKQTLKQELQKTGCGVSGVVLTPGVAPAAGSPGASSAPAAPAAPPAPPDAGKADTGKGKKK